MRAWPAFRSRCWSQSPCVSSTKRTPASTNRRASRHWRPKSAVAGSSRPYRLLGRRRLAREVHHAGERALHAEGQLVRLDDPLDAGVDLLALEQLAVHRLDEVELEPLGGGVEPGVLDVADPGLGDGLPSLPMRVAWQAAGRKALP